MNNSNRHLFSYCPGCGKKTLEPDCDKSFICKQCDFTFFLNAAAAGIALIFNESHQILITVRKQNPFKGMLDFPGGFAEPGETMETCLIREIKEELNLDVLELDYFCSEPSQYLFKNILYPITDMAFFCTINDFSAIKAQDDVADFSFLDVDQLDLSQFGLPSPKKIIRKLQNSKTGKAKYHHE